MAHLCTCNPQYHISNYGFIRAPTSNSLSESLAAAKAAMIDSDARIFLICALLVQAKPACSSCCWYRWQRCTDIVVRTIVFHMQSAAAGTGRLGFVAGLIPQEKLNGFERLLFRATRGNMFLRQTPVGSVKDPATGEQVEKHVFVVFYAGERARTKVLKVRQRGP